LRDLFRKTSLPALCASLLAAAIIHAILRVGSQMPQIVQRSSPSRADEILAASTSSRASSAKNSCARHHVNNVCSIVHAEDEVTEHPSHHGATLTNSPKLFRFAIRIAEKGCPLGHCTRGSALFRSAFAHAP
jgi:hypothetical protein